MCFNIKQYSIYNKECVFSNLILNKCVLIDPERKIALCEREIVKLYCDDETRIRFQNCRPCVAIRNKFLDHETFDNSFLNVIAPGN